MRNRWLWASVFIIVWALLALPAAMMLRYAKGGAWWVLVVATIIPMLAMTYRHLTLSGRLDRQNRSLAENLMQMQLAEGLAGVGRWSVEMATRQHRWSEEVCNIAGLPLGTAPDSYLLGELLPDGIGQMEATLHSHCSDPEPFLIEFEIENPQRGTRVLRARARNAFSPEGARQQVLMVVRDVTDEYVRVAEAERDRAEALAQAEEARRLAETDPLTGLANRRRAMDELDRAIVAARKAGTSLSLAVFDIDHFKAVNDTHGHQIGDEVIEAIARIAERHSRSGQLVARIGGEEFLWILPNADANGASSATERLRLAVEAGTMMSFIPAVTISLGHATLERADTSLSFFARADEALYSAKRLGRNRVALAA